MLISAVFALAAQMSPETESVASEPIEEVVVTGEFPGPGMWKVTRPEDPAGHVMWIVGTPPALPKRMTWKASEVEAVLLKSQEVLMDSGVNLQPDEKIGVFRGLSLLPAALKARRNPDDGTLREQVPPEAYDRWLVLKKKYLGHESGIEKWRPIFAADKLRDEAIKDLDLNHGGETWASIWKLIRKHKIKTTSPTVDLKFPADNIKASIKQFSREKLADVECFSASLSLVEALSDKDFIERRARAWATADLETLESLPQPQDPNVPCSAAILNSLVAKDYLPADIREQAFNLWIESAGKSLAANETTVAMVELDKLLREDGYLAALQAKGYTIEAPK